MSTTWLRDIRDWISSVTAHIQDAVPVPSYLVPSGSFEKDSGSGSSGTSSRLRGKRACRRDGSS